MVGVDQVVTDHREVPWKGTADHFSSSLPFSTWWVFTKNSDSCSFVSFGTRLTLIWGNNTDLPLAWTNKTQQKLKTSLMVQGWRLERRKTETWTQEIQNLKLEHVQDDSPLFTTAVNSRRLLWRRLEDGLEDGDVLLEDDSWNCEVSLQLVGAFTKVLGQVGHVLPLLHLVEELYQAVSRHKDTATLIPDV